MLRKHSPILGALHFQRSISVAVGKGPALKESIAH